MVMDLDVQGCDVELGCVMCVWVIMNVVVDTTGWLDKNRRKVNDDLVLLMTSSTMDLIKQLFTEDTSSSNNQESPTSRARTLPVPKSIARAHVSLSITWKLNKLLME